MANLILPKQIAKGAGKVAKNTINKGVGVVKQMKYAYDKSWNTWKASPRYKKIQKRMDSGIY